MQDLRVKDDKESRSNSMNEVAVVPSFPNLGVTNDGNVMNVKTHRWLKTRDNGHGYIQVFVTVNGHQYMRYVHRLVAECFVPNPDNLPQVNHKDGNKANNYYENLEWCTDSENKKHAYRIGLKVTTERQKQASRANLRNWAMKYPELAKTKRLEAARKADRWGVKGMSEEERIARRREKMRIYAEQHREEKNRKNRERYANMTDAQRQKHNERRRDWYMNMTDEQRESYNAKRRERYKKRIK